MINNDVKSNTNCFEKDIKIIFIDNYLPYNLCYKNTLRNNDPNYFGSDAEAEVKIENMVDFFVDAVIGKIITNKSASESINIKIDKHPKDVMNILSRGAGFSYMNESVFGIRDESDKHIFGGIKIFLFKTVLIDINDKKYILVYSEKRNTLIAYGAKYDDIEVSNVIKKFANTIQDADFYCEI